MVSNCAGSKVTRAAAGNQPQEFRHDEPLAETGEEDGSVSITLS
jgi:hypothetical protein